MQLTESHSPSRKGASRRSPGRTRRLELLGVARAQPDRRMVSHFRTDKGQFTTLRPRISPSLAMPKVVQPLESYRLAQYAVQVPCYVCNEGNTFDAELCRHCFAPMALAHQANAQKVRPQMVAVIGTSGVGKTVYLGMLLDMLSRQPQRMQMLARGAFSITLQQTVMGALGPRRVSGEDSQRAGPLELGALPDSHRRAARAGGTDRARHGRRGHSGRGRASEHLFRAFADFSASAPGRSCWSTPRKWPAAAAIRIILR